MPYIVMAEAIALPNADLRLREEIEALARAVRMEAGNEAFEVFTKPDVAGGWLMIERYRDEAAFHSHLSMPHTMAFNEALSSMAQGGKSSVTRLTLVDEERAARPEIRGIDHVGVTVPDIAAATTFLQDAFGARALYDVQSADAPPMAGEETERQLGLPKGARIVHMRLVRIGASANIELFEVEGVDQASPAGIADPGLQHLAIYADDIAAACLRFTEAGGVLLSDAHPLANAEDGPNNRGVYGRAPWGMLIELIHTPDGVKYPADCVLPRWKPALTN